MTTRAKEIRELGNTGYLEVDANGKVGIGISNPSANFDVRPTRTDTDPLIALFANQASGEDTRVMISTIANQSGDPYIKFDSGGSNMIVGQFWQGTSNNQLKLGVGERPSDGNFKGITVTGSGDVGIGISSPSVNLHVEGNIKSNSGFMINPQTININTTIANDENASVTGPITVEADLIINGNLTVI